MQDVIKALHQKFYAFIVIYESTNWQHYQDGFSQHQCLGALGTTWQRRCWGNFSSINTLSLMKCVESISLAFLTTSYDFSNWIRKFSYHRITTDSQGLYWDCKALSQKVSSNSKQDDTISMVLKEVPSDVLASKYHCKGSIIPCK